MTTKLLTANRPDQLQDFLEGLIKNGLEIHSVIRTHTKGVYLIIHQKG